MSDARLATELATGPPAGPAAGMAGVVRAGRMMAVGTILSRATGFLRTLVIAAAIGETVGDSYNVANTIPNIVYELLLGGVLTSVVVPLLVQARRTDPDAGEAYAQRLLTIVAAGLTGVAVIGVLAAPLVARIYLVHPRVHAELGLAVTFVRYFLPQVIFYGIGALLAAVLNTRGSFAPPMWVPLLNNLVVIATGALFLVVTEGHAPTAGRIGQRDTLILAIGTTVGIVAQTVALVPFTRRVGFRLRLRWDWRRAGLRRAARLGGWVLLYVAANQAAFLAITNLADSGGRFYFSAYTYAFVLVSLPHAIVAVSVITALLPRMSDRAGQGRFRAVADDLAGGLRLTGVLLVPAQLMGMALGPLIGVALFSHGSLTRADGLLIGGTLSAYAVSLVPFSVFQLQLRAFYALQDTRTPALVNIATNVVNLLLDVALFVGLPGQARVIGLALGYSASYFVGCWLFAVLLRRRLLPAPGPAVPQTFARLTVAAVPGTALAAGAAYGVAVAAGRSWVVALGAVVLGAALGLPAYFAFARRVRVAEVLLLARSLRLRARPTA